MMGIRHRLIGAARLAATGFIVLAAAAMISMLLPRVASADTPLAGSAGIATFPPTDSAVTVSGHGRFKDLKVTVGQTKNLINQAISVTWSGGRPTTYANGGSVTGQNFLQLFQCWSDPDPALSGPPPENCVYGGYGSNAKLQSLLFMGGDSTSRIMKRGGAPTPDDPGAVDPSGVVWKPFRAVDGTVTPVQTDFRTSPPAWLNGSFDATTTNEVPAAQTSGQGTGSATFTADTSIEQPALGCGKNVVPTADGSKTTPRCWLVIVPRGTVAEEGSSGATTDGAVGTSPLVLSAWQNRIAVPLEFNPVDSSCGLGADERRIAGSEAAVAAVTSWQPTLCSGPGAATYNYSSISDLEARNQLVRGGNGAAGMAVVSRPVDPANVDSANPVVYAPLTVSGLTIGFNLQRIPLVTPAVTVKDPAEVPLKGTYVADIRLTPRLVAKLLSQSYHRAFSIMDLRTRDPHPGYEWLASNPEDFVTDPDFQQFNPEFQNLKGGQTTGWLIVEESTSDTASQLWSWILADKEATTWLSGTPDAWGMKVNPYYNTKADLNASHLPFADPLPDDYPTSDPYCRYDQTPLDNGMLPRRQCLLDVQPYFSSMESVATTTRAGISGKKEINVSAKSPDAAYVTGDREVSPGIELMGLTDSASADRFGLQTAKLSAAGDDGSTRAFVAPDPVGLLAGVKAMTPTSAVPEILQPAPTSTGTGAYPLTIVTYGAVTPRRLAPASRPDYAAFVDYAVSAGQVPGYLPGQLPPGYASLPPGLVDQAKAAAAKIRSGDPAPPDPATPSAAPAPGPARAQPAAGNTGVGGAAATDQTAAAPSASGPRAGPPVRPGKATTAPRTLLRTIAAGVGAIRYTLPVAVVIAILAGAGAWVIRRRRGDTVPPGPPSESGPLPPASPTPEAHAPADAASATRRPPSR